MRVNMTKSAVQLRLQLHEMSTLKE